MKDDPGVDADVVVVLNQSAGDQILRWADRAHVWVVASELNRQAVRAVWAQGDGNYITTIFEIGQLQSAKEQFLCVVDEIELHHPSWSVMEMHGVRRAPDIVAALRNADTKDFVWEFEDIEDGFIAKRSATHLAPR